MIYSVVHMVDDASWGGVNRLLECLTDGHDGLTRDQHKIVRVERGLMKAPKVEADVIVSHMAICWKNVPFFSSLRATHPEIPLIHVEHSYSERYVALRVEKRDRFSDLMNLSYSLFDRIVAVSQPQFQWLARRGFCQPGQLVEIDSCVRLQHFFDVAGNRPGPSNLTIGAIGRFHEQKGFDVLVDAFVAHAPQGVKLLMVGDGPERELLLAKASRNPNIIFAGATSNPAAAMAECHVVAMPSRWEPYGLVALEAMAAKRPVFCSHVDGLKQHIARGAIAVPENTISGWGQLLRKFPTVAAVDALPKAKSVAGAEWNFIHGWNSLVSDVTSDAVTAQRAA